MSTKSVVVAMSGGVDSSACAAILKDKGLEVAGLTMQIWPRANANKRYCGTRAIKDARRVCAQLGIPHYVLNLCRAFRERVIVDFFSEYQQGRTPNPCIRCNSYIKFGLLLKKARQMGADYLATGHYSRIEFDHKKKRYLLKKGIDASKDQSYALYRLKQEQLRQILMPLGEFTKEQIRQIARKKALPVADKRESQEICFIPDNDYGGFLQRFGPEKAKPGPIIKEGKIIGEHRGIIFYTVGQRKGIGIADKYPLYVISIDKRTNAITVGTKSKALRQELIADKVNLIYRKELKRPIRAEVKVRYLHPPAEARVIPFGKSRLKVRFDRPQFAVTPGQAAVFYCGDIVMGGGRIIKTSGT